MNKKSTRFLRIILPTLFLAFSVIVGGYYSFIKSTTDNSISVLATNSLPVTKKLLEPREQVAIATPVEKKSVAKATPKKVLAQPVLDATLNQPRIKKLPKRTRMDLAYQREFEMTKDPALGYIPIERKLVGYKNLKEKIALKGLNKGEIPNVTWNERGPNNVGGRTRAFMFDPNDATNKKAWAGSVGGGLWYNNDITNANSSWQVVDDFYPNLAISALAFDPSNTQNLYMGTGEGYGGSDAALGAGVYKSTNGGANWTILSATSNNNFKIIIDVVVTSTGKIIVAAGNVGQLGVTGGIYVSTNGGTSFTKKLTGNISDLEIASDGTLYAGVYNNVIQKSTDAGENWTAVTHGGTGGFRVELAVAPSAPSTIYAIAGNGSNIAWFRKTTNGGTTWSSIAVPKYVEQGTGCTPGTQDFTRDQSWYDLILSVHPGNADLVLAGGIDIHRSINGGTSWSPITYWTGQKVSSCGFPVVHADQHNIIFRPGNNDQVVFTNDGGVYYCSNINSVSPTTTGDRIKDYNVTQYYSCAMSNENLGNFYVAGAQDNGSNRYNVAGIDATEEVTGGDGGFVFIDQDNPNIWITSYTNSNYYRSTNGKTSFSYPQISSLSKGQFINPTDYDDTQNILYACGDAGQLYRLINVASGTPADNQVALSGITGVLTALKVSPYTANTVFVADNGTDKIYKVSNANATPTVTAVGSKTFSGNISSIDVGANDNQLLVTISSYGSTSIWETKDGSNWVNKEGDLPDFPVRWGIYNPNNYNQVLLATELGVWSTNDISAAGVEWGLSSTGLANTRCDMLQYRSADKQVAVATHGRGLFTSNVFSEPAANFTANKTLAYTTQSIQFTSTAIGATTYEWDFGDGTPVSTLENPAHSYAAGGTYTVTQKINGGGGTKTLTRTNYITIIYDRPGAYSVIMGGDFETNVTDFVPSTISGTAWERGNSTLNGKDGVTSGANAWVTGITESNIQPNSEAYLYTPNFNLSTPGTYQLSFKSNFLFLPGEDGVIVQYSTNKGTTWTKLGTTVATGWYNDTATANSGVYTIGEALFSNYQSLGNYSSFTYDLSSLTGNASVALRFTFRSNASGGFYTTYGMGMAIDDFAITYTEPLDAKFSADKTTICQGESVTFTDNSTGPAATYSWNFGSGASPQTGNVKGPHTVTYNTPGQYTVTLTVNGADTETKNNYITVKALPATKTLSAKKSAVCSGDSTFIQMSASETGTVYQLINSATSAPIGNTLTGTGDTLNFRTGPITTATSYKVMADKDGCKSTFTSTATVNINAAPVSKVVIAQDPRLCLDNAGTSIIIKSSESGASYQLRNNADNTNLGSPKTGNGQDLDFATGSLNANITYNVVATKNTCVLPLTDKPTVTINDQPQGKTIATLANMVCPGGATAIVIQTSENGVSYQLRNNANNQAIGSMVNGNGATIELPTGALTTATTFNVLAFNGCNAAMNNTVEVTVTSPPADKVVTATKTEVCTGVATTIIVGASESNVLYQLRRNSTNAAIGDAIAGTGSDISFPTGNLTDSITYNVFASKSGCTTLLSGRPKVAVLTINKERPLTITPSTLCDSGFVFVTIKNAQSGVTYQLRSNPSNAPIGQSTLGDNADATIELGMVKKSASYNVLATLKECSAVLTATTAITVSTKPSVAITRNGATLFATAGGATYQWYINDTLISGAKQSSYKPTVSANYTVHMTKSGCTGVSQPFNYTAPISALSTVLDESQILLFPNPAASSITISIENKVEGDFVVNIYNQTGQLVQTERFVKTGGYVSQSIAIDKLANGIYYAEISDGKGYAKKVFSKGL